MSGGASGATLAQGQQLTPAQVRRFQEDIGKIARLLDPRPPANYLLSRILDKIDRGEPLTPEDLEELAKPPKDLICEIRLPAEPPEPPIDPRNPKPPHGGWEKVRYIIAQILRFVGQYVKGR
jgi:hypothetical protein